MATRHGEADAKDGAAGEVEANTANDIEDEGKDVITRAGGRGKADAKDVAGVWGGKLRMVWLMSLLRELELEIRRCRISELKKATVVGRQGSSMLTEREFDVDGEEAT